MSYGEIVILCEDCILAGEPFRFLLVDVYRGASVVCWKYAFSTNPCLCNCKRGDTIFCYQI
jgi:hypothetical protein